LSKGRYLFLTHIAVLAIFPVLVLQTALADKGPPRTGWMEQFTVIDNPLPAPRVPLSNGEGSQVLLSDFKGKVVLVNFWATWCAPCVREMPGIDKLQAKLGGSDFTVVAINEDRDGAARAKPFLEKLGTSHLALYVDSKMAMMRAFKVRGLPTSYLLDREGRIVGKLEGIAEWDTPEVEALIHYYTKRTTSARTPWEAAISG
jgi:thiol-disulfide isomerase/thioredoxin